MFKHGIIGTQGICERTLFQLKQNIIKIDLN